MRVREAFARLALTCVALSPACFYDWDKPLATVREDGGVPLETSTEAGPPTAFCQDATFCETFDTHELLPIWDIFEKGGGVAIEAGDGPSPPKLFRVRHAGSTGTVAAGTWIAHVVEVPGNTFDLKFSIHPEQLESASEEERASVGGLVLADGLANERSARISLRKSRASFERREQDGSYTQTPLDVPPAVGVWSEVLLHVGPDGSMQVKINGVGRAIGPSPGWPPSSSRTRVNIGINFATAPTTGWRIAYDDVRLDVK